MIGKGFHRIGVTKQGKYQIIKGIGSASEVVVDNLTRDEVINICTLSAEVWAKNALDFLLDLGYYTNRRYKYT